MAIAVDRALQAPVAVDPSRCVASRHRASGCRACVEACGAQALHFEAGRVAVDALACDGCLACVSACPTEAVSAVGEADRSVSAQADAALEAAGGIAVFACHRALEQADVDLSAVTAVPCLARLDESLLVEQAARGAYALVLVDGGCAGCPRGACDGTIDETVACADEVLALCGAGVVVERTRAFPAEVARSGEDGYDAGRRFLFTQVAAAAKDEALKAAGTLAGGRDESGVPSSWDPTEPFEVHRRMRLLDAVDTMGVSRRDRLSIRRFHTVDAVADRCVGCGVCALFCPTGALRTGGSGASGELEWSAAECTGCSLCRDVCACDAIVLTPGVSCGELLDFEPRPLHGEAGSTRPCAPAAPQRSAWGTPHGSVASRFFAGNRAVDPAAERMRQRVALN